MLCGGMLPDVVDDLRADVGDRFGVFRAHELVALLVDDPPLVVGDVVVSRKFLRASKLCLDLALGTFDLA